MSSANEVLVYIGTYTERTPDNSGSKGIYLARLDLATGKLSPFEVAAELQNPSFLAAWRGRHLFAVSEVGDPDGHGGTTGYLSAFTIADDGKLTLINRKISGGADPCHVSVTKSGTTVAVANYTGGSIATYHVHANGALDEPATIDHRKGSGPNHERQEGAHAHSVDFSPDERFLISADLGADRLFIYRHALGSAKVVPHDPPFVALEPGSGPRHFVLHPDGKHAYAINELTNSIAAFDWNGMRGTLRQTQTISTLPLNYTASNSTAEIVVHPSGRFVYGSNRGHDSIAVFSVDAKTGRLTFVEHTPTGGNAPRNFAIDPHGYWLIAANQLSDSLVMFAIDQKTGTLEATGDTVKIPRPVCVVFV